MSTRFHRYILGRWGEGWVFVASTIVLLDTDTGIWVFATSEIASLGTEVEGWAACLNRAVVSRDFVCGRYWSQKFCKESDCGGEDRGRGDRQDRPGSETACGRLCGAKDRGSYAPPLQGLRRHCWMEGRGDDSNDEKGIRAFSTWAVYNHREGGAKKFEKSNKWTDNLRVMVSHEKWFIKAIPIKQ